MPQIKVDTVICINGSILIVYYTPGQCWQFRVIRRRGEVFGEQKLYYTARAALKMGLSWLKDEV
ncbi:hypothetical protein H6G76_35175 [Nostoc sp. FACHB-152]|uniref:hypothetical protein n=1 Tax=Nostoc sp. FACHB-152 TaxID=2692837 RepID=UPI001686E53B|nr:hypothetical protein [Nostoc sp. FACHB-152]MBD2452254.1 hypothetical protein [Nostoc sp. FACHB-152]